MLADIRQNGEFESDFESNPCCKERAKVRLTVSDVDFRFNLLVSLSHMAVGFESIRFTLVVRLQKVRRHSFSFAFFSHISLESLLPIELFFRRLSRLRFLRLRFHFSSL